MITFFVTGVPVPKQSFRYKNEHGRIYGYQKRNVEDWQNTVRFYAGQIIKNQNLTMILDQVAIALVFLLPDKRRKDLDNLEKGTLDALNDLMWKDDNQIIVKMSSKRLVKDAHACGVYICIESDKDKFPELMEYFMEIK